MKFWSVLVTILSLSFKIIYGSTDVITPNNIDLNKVELFDCHISSYRFQLYCYRSVKNVEKKVLNRLKEIDLIYGKSFILHKHLLKDHFYFDYRYFKCSYFPSYSCNMCRTIIISNTRLIILCRLSVNRIIGFIKSSFDSSYIYIPKKILFFPSRINDINYKICVSDSDCVEEGFVCDNLLCVCANDRIETKVKSKFILIKCQLPPLIGDLCHRNGECQIKNKFSTCVERICICPADSLQRKVGNNTFCLFKKFLGEKCAIAEQCQDAGNNALECKDHICSCKVETDRKSNSLCYSQPQSKPTYNRILYISVTVVLSLILITGIIKMGFVFKNRNINPS